MSERATTRVGDASASPAGGGDSRSLNLIHTNISPNPGPMRVPGRFDARWSLSDRYLQSAFVREPRAAWFRHCDDRIWYCWGTFGSYAQDPSAWHAEVIRRRDAKSR